MLNKHDEFRLLQYFIQKHYFLKLDKNIDFVIVWKLIILTIYTR